MAIYLIIPICHLSWYANSTMSPCMWVFFFWNKTPFGMTYVYSYKSICLYPHKIIKMLPSSLTKKEIWHVPLLSCFFLKRRCNALFCPWYMLLVIILLRNIWWQVRWSVCDWRNFLWYFTQADAETDEVYAQMTLQPLGPVSITFSKWYNQELLFCSIHTGSRLGRIGWYTIVLVPFQKSILNVIFICPL